MSYDDAGPAGYCALCGKGFNYTGASELCGPCTEHIDEEQQDEGPTCSICDGLGHGYPGGGPCPLEERGGPDYDDERSY